MKIKRWQKIFICCFAVIFVAIFFAYDCLLINNNQNFADEIVVDDLLKDELLKDEMQEEETDENIKDEDAVVGEQPEKPVENIPNYKNGYDCLLDAYKRIHEASSYKMVMASKSSSAGVVQNVKCIKQKCNNVYSTENFAYTDSFLGRVFYSKATTQDMKTFNYIYTEDVDSNFSYNLDNAEKRVVNSLQEIKSLVGGNVFNVLTLEPTKDNGKLVSFDRISSLEYYNITFAFNVNKLPQTMLDEMKHHSGAKEINYSSCMLEVQISRKDGNIKRVTTKEIYKMNVHGLNIEVQTVASSLISNINENFKISL